MLLESIHDIDLGNPLGLQLTVSSKYVHLCGVSRPAGNWFAVETPPVFMEGRVLCGCATAFATPAVFAKAGDLMCEIQRVAAGDANEEEVFGAWPGRRARRGACGRAPGQLHTTPWPRDQSP